MPPPWRAGSDWPPRFIGDRAMVQRAEDQIFEYMRKMEAIKEQTAAKRKVWLLNKTKAGKRVKKKSNARANKQSSHPKPNQKPNKKPTASSSIHGQIKGRPPNLGACSQDGGGNKKVRLTAGGNYDIHGGMVLADYKEMNDDYPDHPDAIAKPAHMSNNTEANDSGIGVQGHVTKKKRHHACA